MSTHEEPVTRRMMRPRKQVLSGMRGRWQPRGVVRGLGWEEWFNGRPDGVEHFWVKSACHDVGASIGCSVLGALDIKSSRHLNRWMATNNLLQHAPISATPKPQSGT